MSSLDSDQPKPEYLIVEVCGPAQLVYFRSKHDTLELATEESVRLTSYARESKFMIYSLIRIVTNERTVVLDV